MNQPLIGFSIPVYDRFDHLKVILSCLQVQTHPDWIATIVKDGHYTTEELEIVHSFTTKDPRISYTHTPERTNNWGHTPRELGKHLLSGHCQYVVMTGDDNYYTPNLVEEVSKVAHAKAGMIYWNMVHSHYDYQLFRCTVGFNQIDIGAFATRSDIAATIQLPTSYAADGEFVEIYKQRYPEELNLKIDKVLYVHN